MGMDLETQADGRKRITQIFHYLEELNQRRNPIKKRIEEQPWRMRLADLPANEALTLGKFSYSSQEIEETEKIEVPSLSKAATNDDFILKVGRATLTEAPQPPKLIADWIHSSWTDPNKAIQVVPSRKERDSLEENFTVVFQDSLERQSVLSSWQPIWEEWAEKERPARAAQKLFEDLYGLYRQMEREAERQELVLGDGILSWRQSEGTVRHPILIQRLKLYFDPQKPEFILRDTDSPIEFYSALVRGEVDGTIIARCRAELEQGSFHPLEQEATSAFLKRLALQLSARGEFVDNATFVKETENPVISRDPVLFLRSRTLGFAAALESILRDLPQREDLPISLLNVAGIEPLAPTPSTLESTDAIAAPANDEHILLSKPANQEQVEIAQRLDAYNCVLVQGPPGTGKTHTIANLIGHLLAQGKSILVTSHTAKALRVLREQVVPDLQPLCVSVLEGEGESRQQLEHSVAAIVERLASTDADTMLRQGESLAHHRLMLREALSKQRTELQNARFDEYRDIVVAGQSFSPSDAARRVALGKEKEAWIPTPVSLGAPLPLTTGELIALYRTNATLTAQDEQDILGPLPKFEDLIAPPEFAQILKERQELETEDLTVSVELWQQRPNTKLPDKIEARLAQTLQSQVTPEAISTLLQKATQAVILMTHGTDWQFTAVDAGRHGGPQQQTWDSLLIQINELGQEAAVAQEALMQYGPSLSVDETLETQIKTLSEVVSYLEDGNHLSWLALLTHNHWKKFLPNWSVSGKAPASTDEFRSLKTFAELELHRTQLKNRWDRQMAPLGGVASRELGPQPEVACRQYQPLIQAALDWYPKTWLPLEQEFQSLGFDWPQLLQKTPIDLTVHGDLIRLRDAVLQLLPTVFRSRANHLRALQLRSKIVINIRVLEPLLGQEAAPVIHHLHEALTQDNADAYKVAYERLVELNRKSSDLTTRREMLQRLEVSAPAWANAIRDRRPLHDSQNLPGDAEAAWMWRQISDELNRRQQVSLNSLQQKIAQVSSQLQKSTAELVDKRAWAAQIKRTNQTQRMALIGWLQTVRRIGKGTGKNVPKLQIEARRLMGEARSAVPVWIMPLTRVVESFDPASTRFDVVIIDEASQSDAMSLIALYMGKQVVVVGDDEQVSPDAVGENIEDTQNLIAEHLEGIPNAHLYDGKQSIYDLALSSFGGTICLREHFRCVSDIIQFSNRLSYGGKIKPLRDDSAVVTKPFVVNYRVEGATSANKVNEEEALAVASLLIAATEQIEYEGATFGVIPLVGEEQALRIDTLLREHLSLVEYQERRIMCGTPPQFQGDERDVIFLSVVDGPQNGPLPIKQQPLFKKRFNVAASRARNQMWVVHSLSVQQDLKPGDLRRDLIEHAQNPQAFERLVQEKESETDSEFERQVLRRLMRAGYQVRPQWNVGSYRIDMVVEGSGKRLAVECDGDRYHTLDNLADDMQRQAILERLGWTFVRIRGSEFFRDPEQAMQSLFNRLQQMEIEPIGLSSVDKDTPISDAGGLQTRIIRRADELRREWTTYETHSFAHSADGGLFAAVDSTNQ
jgi:very-short-patch-repair endonuclease